MVVASVVAVVAGAVARWRAVQHAGWVAVSTWSTLVVLAATLVPTANDVTRSCGLVPQLPGVADLAGINQTSLNVLLFVPMGVAASWSGERRRVTLLVAALLPFAVEAVQFAVPSLGRACQATDVILNLSGLGLGFVLGSIAFSQLGMGLLERSRL